MISVSFYSANLLNLPTQRSTEIPGIKSFDQEKAKEKKEKNNRDHSRIPRIIPRTEVVDVAVVLIVGVAVINFIETLSSSADNLKLSILARR